jgi:hypothetical protein
MKYMFRALLLSNLHGRKRWEGGVQQARDLENEDLDN